MRGVFQQDSGEVESVMLGLRTDVNTYLWLMTIPNEKHSVGMNTPSQLSPLPNFTPQHAKAVGGGCFLWRTRVLFPERVSFPGLHFLSPLKPPARPPPMSHVLLYSTPSVQLAAPSLLCTPNLKYTPMGYSITARVLTSTSLSPPFIRLPSFDFNWVLKFRLF